MEFLQVWHTAPWSDVQAWRWLARVFTGNVVQEALFYGAAASLIGVLLHGVLRRRLARRLIGQWPTAADVRREMTYSLSTLLVFAAVGVAVVAAVVTGRAEVYVQVQPYGWTWLVLSFVLMLLWHDLYFYVTHRLLHTRWWFRRVHGVHHRSRHPSPWAAYAFHPLEALINAMVVPLALVVIPLHVGVLLAFTAHQVLRNAHGHAAVETMPAGFSHHRLWGHFTTTTHHHMHHETAKGNYGLWFTWWDRWMGTEIAQYRQRFDEVTGSATP
ncbi:MAG: sterol desaturase family protein [Rhodoferax sp.]|nr:sterol desaturase family protein [Rhodoferax sp.]